MANDKKKKTFHMFGHVLIMTKLSVLLVCFAWVGMSNVQAQTPTVQYVVHANELQLAAYEQIAAEFTEATGIPVEIIATPGGQKGKWERIITLVAGGISPDVVGGVSTEFGEFAFEGLLRPLDDLIVRSHVDMDGLIPPVVQALQFQGQQFLLPYGASALAMFYNIHHFDRAGLGYPPQQWNTPEWTYDTFVDTARKTTVRDGDGRISQYGIAGPFWDSWITLPYPWGGRWVSDDLKTFEGTKPEAVAALQAFQDLIHQYEVMPATGASSNFTRGEAAMAGIGTWNLARTLVESDEEWDFMPWFRVQDHAQAAINPIGYGILSTSSNVEGAWEFIKWLTWNEKANLDYSIAAGAIPSLVSNLPDWRHHWNQLFGRTVASDRVIEQAALHGSIINIRKSPAFWTINDIMAGVASDVLANRKSAQAAMNEVADYIQMLLEQSAP